MSEDKATTIGLRPPPELMEWLRREAQDNARSLNAQVVWTLQQYRKLQEVPAAKAAS